MADEKLTLELQLKGYAEAISRLGSVGNAVGALGSGNLGGLGTIGAGAMAAGRMGSFTSGLAIAGSALAGLAATTKGAAESLASFGRMRTTLGSTASETAMLRVLGGALGISDVRGLAERVHTSLRSGLGAAMAAEIGIGREQDLGPNAVNQGRNLLRVIQHIREARNEEEALSRARRAGAEELAEIWQYSAAEFRKMAQEARELERTFSPDRLQRAREFNREMDRFGRKLEQLKVGVATPALGAVNRFLENPLKGPFHAIGGSVGEEILRGVQGGQKDALRENTQAMKELSTELRMQKGIYGGGSRARSAIPRAFGPGAVPEVRKQMRAGAIRMGAYAVSM